MRNRNTVKRGLPLVVVALLAAACSSPDAPSDARPGAPRTGASPTRSHPPAAPPKPSSPPPLSAEDGTDVKACRGADCEIVVRGTVHVPLESTFDIPRFVLTYKAPNEVAFDITRPRSNDMHGSIQGTGYVGLADGVKFTVKKVDTTGAVIRFEPRTVSPGYDKAEGSEGMSIY